jgi:hypothetical protein
MDGDKNKSGEIQVQSVRSAETTVQIKIVSGSGRTLKMDIGKGKPKVEQPQETRNDSAGPYIYKYPVKINHTERGLEVHSCGNKVEIVEYHIKIEASEVNSTIYINKKNIRLKVETSHEKIHIFSIDEDKPENLVEYTKIDNAQNNYYYIDFRECDKKLSKGSVSYLGEVFIEKGKNIIKKVAVKDGVDIEVLTYHEGNHIQIYRNGKVIIVENHSDKRILKVRKKGIIDLELKI